MLQTKVKASSITNLTDARYFAAWEVEWLGFNFDPNAENNIKPNQALAIKEWIDGPKIIGEFAMATAAEIQGYVNSLALDAVQIGMLADQQLSIELNATIPVIKEYIVESSTTDEIIWDHLETFAPYASSFLIDFEKNNFSWNMLAAGTPFSLSFLKKLCQEYPILISLDLNADILSTLLSDINPHGISILGGVEEKTGYKSFDELDEIFEQLVIEI